MLIVGYELILRASEDARDQDFTIEKQKLVRKFRTNPLATTFCSLSDFLVSHSAESLDLIRSKTRSRSASPTKKPKVSEPIMDEEIIPLDHSPSIPADPCINTATISPATPATTNKRVFSGESYGSSSTETTPSRMSHSETLTQSLQNTLVGALIFNIWDGGANIPWAQNRKMYLDYRPYILHKTVLIIVLLLRHSVANWKEIMEKLTTVLLPSPMAHSSSLRTRSRVPRAD